MSQVDRRDFVRQAGKLGLALAAAPTLLASKSAFAANAPDQGDSFCAFTESFQDWPIPKVCEQFKEIGLDGLDLTVRPGGHIDPADAAQKLPPAAKAAKDHGVRISMLTTSITDADDQSERLLATAGELGIDRVKAGYYRYETFGSLLEQIDDSRRKLERVVRLGAKHKVLPCVHIHSGNIIPGNGPVAYLLLKDFAPDEVGAYADPMHMTIEGGSDGWRQGLDLLAPWIAISSFKNCMWTTAGRDEHGQERWETRKCPVADGIAPIPDYIATLREIGYRGLYSMHSEYKDGNTWKRLSTEECLAQTREDLNYVKQFFQG
jgi:sugar phosphate isomerase/epimerase